MLIFATNTIKINAGLYSKPVKGFEQGHKTNHPGHPYNATLTFLFTFKWQNSSKEKTLKIKSENNTTN